MPFDALRLLRAIRHARAGDDFQSSTVQEAAGHEQAVLGRRVEWLPDMDWCHFAASLGDRASRVPSPLRSVEPWFSSIIFINIASQYGCPTWIRTMTRRVKVACATITPSGSDEWNGHAAALRTPVKAGNIQ